MFAEYIAILGRISKRTYFIGTLYVLALILAGTFVPLNNFPKAYAVVAGGKEIAVVAKPQTVELLLKETAESFTVKLKQPVRLAEPLGYRPVRAVDQKITSTAELERIMTDELEWQTGGAVIKVNAEMVASLTGRQAAEKVLDQLKSTYLGGTNSSSLPQITFLEDVQVEERNVNISELLSAEEALSLIRAGRTRELKYIVREGDNLWDIAKANDLTEDRLRELNPQLRSEILPVGTELKLAGKQPLINVALAEEIKIEESIPFPVRVEPDSSLSVRVQKVKQEGINGKKEVSYKIVKINGKISKKEKIAEQIILTAVEKIVIKGTKRPVAQIASRDSGPLAWPTTSRRITSGHGPRGGGFHKGIDIDGVIGDPIYAVSGGKVVFAGWESGYGKRIVIDHGNGLRTAYSHNSANLVSVGDTVSRGQLIGRIGNTGNVQEGPGGDGSHLDLEIWLSGNHVDPLKWLR